MKCNICRKNEAIIRIHEYSEKGNKKIDLCLECALEKGLGQSVGNIDNFIANMIHNIFHHKKGKRRKMKKGHIMQQSNMTIVCPECKTSINTVTEDAKVGCPSCYVIFGQIADLLIYRQNNSLTYRGKLPEDLDSVRKNRIKLRQLKKELRYHVRNENYTDAAGIRDQIREIRKSIKTRIKEIANK